MPRQTIAAAKTARLGRIDVSIGSVVRVISVREVCYFQANDKYTSVFTPDSEALIRTSLKELSDQLDPARFWQIHRSTIVNVEQVAGTTRDLSRHTAVRLKSRPEALPVSRAFVHLFRQM
jgi:DNA-binding LytR/AlgR family response regulator